jgi:hypothetical protein
VSELLSKKFALLPFDGEFLAAIGQPERSGNWIIGGASASGKTTFIFKLAKYMTRFDRVYYNSLEEGAKRTTQMALERTGMIEARSRFIITREPIDEMTERLRKRKSPNIVVVDSIQHSMITKREYMILTREFPSKLFIWVTHMDDRNKPVGAIANFVWYDADVKMRTEGYKMFADSRYQDGAPTPYVIWDEGAANYWGDI